jgi:hypothetical protein
MEFKEGIYLADKPRGRSSLLGILLGCWLLNFGAIWFINNKICD